METEEAAGDELIHDGDQRVGIILLSPSAGASTEQNSPTEHVCCPLLVERANCSPSLWLF